MKLDDTRMVLGQLAPYCRRRDHCTEGDRWGAAVAHHDLVEAALRYDSVSGVSFFLKPGSAEPDGGPAVTELREAFPHKEITVKAPLELCDPGLRRHVLAVPLEMLPGLAHLRQHTGARFPITAFVHSIPSHAHWMLYVAAILAAQEHDTIVATSRAGQRAIAELLQAAVAQLSQESHGLRSLKAEIAAIPLGVDDEFFRPRPQAACRSALGLPPEGRYLLYVGRFSERFKADLEPLLIACRELAGEFPDLRLILAGRDNQDSYSRSVRELAEQVGIAGRLDVFADFPYSQKPLLYSAADVFVSPVDNVQETFGLAVLEAMAAELPVVASDWSGYRELVADGQTGFLVPTFWSDAAGRFATLLDIVYGGEDAGHFLAQNTIVDTSSLNRLLRRLLGDRELRQQFGAAGRRRVLATFRWSRVIKDLEVLWQQQWARSERRLRTRASCASAGCNEVFGHFAAAALTAERMVRLHGERRSGPGDVHRRAIPVPPWIPGGEVARILNACSAAPQSIGSLTRNEDGAAFAAAWLLKKAYLQLDTTAPDLRNGRCRAPDQERRDESNMFDADVPAV